MEAKTAKSPALEFARGMGKQAAGLPIVPQGLGPAGTKMTGGNMAGIAAPAKVKQSPVGPALNESGTKKAAGLEKLSGLNELLERLLSGTGGLVQRGLNAVGGRKHLLGTNLVDKLEGGATPRIQAFRMGQTAGMTPERVAKLQTMSTASRDRALANVGAGALGFAIPTAMMASQYGTGPTEPPYPPIPGLVR